MDRQDIRKAIQQYTNAVSFLKDKTIEYIDSMKETENIQRINQSCFIISFGALDNKILSPFYYDVAAQKRVLKGIVEKSKNFEYLNIFSEIAKNGKRLVRNSMGSYTEYFAPCVQKELASLLLDFNLDAK